MRSKKDLVAQAVIEIEEWIKSGQYNEKDLLPSEADISKQLGMSRPTVRDAIRILEVRGFVERIHGVGIRVKNRSVEVAISSLKEMIERNDISYKELLQVRRFVEPKACALAAKYATEDALKKLKECVEILETEVDDETHAKADYQFHDIIIEQSKNRLLHAIVQSYGSLLFQQINMVDKNGKDREAELKYHRKIYESIEKRDCVMAEEAMLIHLDETEMKITQYISKRG